MKIIIMLLVLLFTYSGATFAETKTITLTVEKMTCALCPFTVKTAINNVDGVSAVDVNFANKTAEVTFDDTITTENSITSASTNAGYPAKLE